LLIQINQYLRGHGIEVASLHLRNPRPCLKIMDTSASPLNEKAKELGARGFKLIYLLPEHFSHFDEKLLLFPCYYAQYIAISAAALMDVERFLNSPILKSAELIVAAQTSAPWHQDALNKVAFYGQNFADIRPLNFKTSGLGHLNPKKFPHAAFILNEKIPIYVPFHEAQEAGFGQHHFRAIDLHKRLEAVYARIRQEPFSWQDFNSSEPADISDAVYEANTLVYRLIYSMGWYLLHNTAFFYILLNIPENVTYTHDAATHTLSIVAYPDLYRSSFYYTLEMPWFDPAPSNGDTAWIFKSRILQVYFRYIYAMFFSLEDAEYKFGKDLFTLTYGQLQQLLKEWVAVAHLPEKTEKNVRKLLWTRAEFTRKIKVANQQTVNIFSFLDSKQGRALRGCANLVTSPPPTQHRPKKNF